MKKLFVVMIPLIVAHSTVVAWPWRKKQEAPTPTLSNDEIKIMNQHINIQQAAKDINNLRIENADLKSRLQEQEKKAQQVIAFPAQQEELNKLRQENKILKDENQRTKQEIRDLKQDGTQALKEMGVEAAAGLYAAYQTFNTNLPSFHFDKALAEYKDKLPSVKAVRALNNEMANTLYSMKFMYFEARYHLDWMGRQLVGKGIDVPNINKALSEEEIKSGVMKVRVVVD